MADQAHNLQNAKLGAKLYGKGQVKDSAELAYLKKVMGPGFAGLNKGALCVLGAWLEGKQPRQTADVGLFTVNLGSDDDGSAEASCEQSLQVSVPSVAQALGQLRAISSSLADLVEVKGGSKSASLVAWLWETDQKPPKPDAKPPKPDAKPPQPSTPPPGPSAKPVNWKLVAVALVAVALLAGGAWLLLGRLK